MWPRAPGCGWDRSTSTHPESAPLVRAGLLVTVIDAAVHTLDPDLDRRAQTTEIIRLATGYAAALGEGEETTVAPVAR